MIVIRQHRKFPVRRIVEGLFTALGLTTVAMYFSGHMPDETKDAFREHANIAVAGGRWAGRKVRFVIGAALALAIILLGLMFGFANMPHQVAMTWIPYIAGTLVVGTIVLAFWKLDALAWLAIGIGLTRSTVRIAALTVLAEVLAIVWYFTIVPVSLDSALAPAVIISIIGFLVATLAKNSNLQLLFGLQIAVLTLIFFCGGRTAAKQKVEAINIQVPQVFAWNQTESVGQTQTTRVTTTESTQPQPSSRPSFCDAIPGHGEEKTYDFSTEDRTNFDIPPTSNCFEGWVTPPRDWKRWNIELIGGGDDCRVWFWFAGQNDPKGPFDRTFKNNFYQYPASWRVATTGDCTVRYKRG